MSKDAASHPMPIVRYRTQTVGNNEMFYREAGPADGPVLLLLHGFPTASHMVRDLIPLLADRYHSTAPDLPGFGSHTRATCLMQTFICWIPVASRWKRITTRSLLIFRNFSAEHAGCDATYSRKSKMNDTRCSKEFVLNWEYLTIETTMTAADLNALGAERWELVAVASPGHFVLHYFLKREVRP